MMSKITRTLVAGTAAMFSLAMLTVDVAQAATSPTAPVVIAAAELDAVQTACAGGSAAAACTAAMAALVAALKAANPGVALLDILGSIASSIASLSNDGIAGKVKIDPAALALALSSLATYASENGLADFAKTVTALASNVQSGVTIDLAAVASGAGQTAVPANPASPA